MNSETFVGPIKAIKMLTTGSGGQHKEHRYGSWLPSWVWLLTSRSWIYAPVNVIVIEHQDGLVLFDAGMDPAVASDAAYISHPVGRFVARRLFRFRIGPEDALSRKLEALGYSARDVSKVVVSHLHFDHVGGISEVPQADLLVSRAEWKQLSGPHPERDFILREHIEVPDSHWQQIDFAVPDDPLLMAFGGSFDLMGDGSLVLLSTPGHTPGSMSMLVRTEGCAPILLVGDLTYDVEMLLKDRVPGTGDADVLKKSFASVRALMAQLPDLVILPTHDCGAAAALAEATRKIKN